MNHLVAFPHNMTPQQAGATSAAAMYIAGVLPEATVGQSYYGTLDIFNAIGACKVRLVEGDLPLGHTLAVDNDTKQIVISWPAYAQNFAPVANSGFEAGDIGWSKGSGWTITSDNAPTGEKAAVFFGFSGESVIRNDLLADCTPGEPLAASCNVRQGASSAGNAGGRVQLEFYNSSGVLFHTAEGNVVDSASNNAVKPSVVSTTVPVGATRVGLAGWAFRKRQNRKLWLDDFQWNLLQSEVGVNSPGLWCITLEVEDAIGRTAQWSGCIEAANYARNWFALYVTATNNVAVSTGGLDWDENPVLMPSGPLGRIFVGGGRVTLYGTAPGVTSLNGGAWESLVGAASPAGSNRAGVYHPQSGRSFIFGGTGIVRRSTDGVHYAQTHTLSMIGSQIEAVVLDSGTIVFSSVYRSARSNNNGDSWDLAGYYTGGDIARCMGTDGIKILLGRQDNVLMAFNNGSNTWSVVASPFSGTGQIGTILHNGNVWLLRNAAGAIATSPTGNAGSWTISSAVVPMGSQTTYPQGNGANGLFVLGGPSGSIYTSSDDGVSFQLSPHPAWSASSIYDIGTYSPPTYNAPPGLWD